MTLQEKLKKDLMEAMKAKDETRKSTIRVIMGEFARMESKTLSDEEVVRIIRKCIKSEKELLEKKGEDTSAFIEIAESYLPRMVTEEEIADWIRQNVDFSEFSNKMQSMRVIMAHFGERADGNTVKKILQSI